MIDPTRYPLLSRIDSPRDLRALPESELPAVTKELREYLIESVGRSGGHFGAGLGVGRRRGRANELQRDHPLGDRANLRLGGVGGCARANNSLCTLEYRLC